jgi:hypothetical protein
VLNNALSQNEYMNRLALILILIGGTAQAIEVDKAAHFGAGYICQDILYNTVFKPEQKPHRVGVLPKDTLAPKLMTAGTCFMLGMFKEALDSQGCQERTGKYCGLDSGDLLANGLGIATKSLLQISFDF